MGKLELLLKFIERHTDDPESLKVAEAAYALANGNAVTHRVPSEDRAVIHTQKDAGCVSWSAIPPAGIGIDSHMVTFLRVIEQASLFLGTDHSTTVETLVCGNVIKTIALTHPQFVPYAGMPEPLPTVGRCVYHGALARRYVLFDPDLKPEHGFLTSGTGKVLISVLEHQFICST